MKTRFRRSIAPVAALACALIVVQVVLATPPTNVDFTVAPGSPLVGEQITFTSTAQDDDIVSTEWDFDYDGVTFDADATGLPDDNDATHTYNTAGTRTVAMRVTDGILDDGDPSQETVTNTVTVSAPNTPPTASFTVSPNPADAGETVTFDASGSSDTEGPMPAGGYDWDLDGDGAYDDATGQTVTRSYASGGAKTIRLRVTDSAGANATTFRVLNVNNAAPTAAFTISPNPAGAGQTVTFNGSGSTDPEGPISDTNHDWDLDGNGTFEATGKVVSRSYSTGGPRQITLQVTDSNGATDTETHTLNVSGAAPTASFTISPNPARVREDVTLNGSASSDPEGPIAAADHDWDLDGDGEYDDASGQTVTHAFAQPGSHVVGLRVTDSDDNADTDTRTVTVVNTPPTASFTISPSPTKINQQVTFDGTGSNDDGDPGGAIASYAWDLDGDGAFDDATGAVVNHAYPRHGTFAIRLRVTDNNGASDTSDTKTLRVNAKPTASFSWTPNPPVVNESIAFDASQSADFDGDIASYQWDFNYDGSFHVDATGPNPTTSYPTAGTRSVRLRVTDNDGDTSELSRPVVVQLTRPNARFSFTPEAPLPGQPVVFTSRSTPSGGPTNPQIQKTEWDFDYEPTEEFTPDVVGGVATMSFPTPGAKTVAIRVTETGGGFAIATANVVVNAPPRASFNVSPGSPFDGDTVTLSSTSADPDGPLAAQQWDLDGDGQYDDASGAVVTRALPTGSHVVRLRVIDARGAVATAERRINVAPRPPKLLEGVKISLQGNLTPQGAELERLWVRTPRGATVRITCKGRGCPKGVTRKLARKTKRLRFKKFERSFRAGTVIIVTVTKTGYIGQYTTIKIRDRLRRYLRRDRCVLPASSKPTICPSS